MDTPRAFPLAVALLVTLFGCDSRPPPSAPKQGRTDTAARSAEPPRRVSSVLSNLAQKQTVPPQPDLPEPAQPQGAASLSSGQGETVLEFPLKHTQVVAHVAGNIARVEVTQLYQNPSADRLEAIYKFPLPANAAVTDMYFRIGNRIVYSEVKRKQEARQTYERARDEGRTAALTEQERPNLFTQSVANIPPGETVAVVLRYVNELPYDDGRYVFAFPTTIGPRFIPGEPTHKGDTGGGWGLNTEQVPDATRITPPVVPPGFRSAHDLDILVSIAPGDAFTQPSAKSHRVVTGFDGKGARLVALAEDDRIPNKDFVLAWSPKSEVPEARALVQREKGDDYLMLFVQPPADVPRHMVRARELVFLLDKSCSMSGQPLDAARGLVERSLDTLGPDDTFEVKAFDGSVVSASEAPLPNTPQNVAMAKQWMRSLSGSGGTYMLNGIRAALTPPEDPKRLRMVVFATDGFIGNETEILQAIEELRGKARVFGFGIGSSVNRYLIDGMGRVGRGASDVILLNEDPGEAVARLFKRLDRPVLTDLGVTFDGMEVADVLPEKLPDLFAGQPLVVIGKLARGTQGTVTLTGKLGSRPWKQTVRVVAEGEDGSPVLGTLWARRKIEDLSFRHITGPSDDEIEGITNLGLRFKLITQYTSFVAVERELKVDPGVPLTQVLIPNEMPEGVSFDALFGDAHDAEAEATPTRVKPGDPELRVKAGAGAQAVRVALPFEKSMREAVFDAATGEHVVRFLVPAQWPDGRYDARVEIAYADGSRITRLVPIKVDTAPAAMGVLSAPTVAAPGERIRIVLKPVVPLASLASAVTKGNPGGVGEALKSSMEVKEILVRAPWGEIVEASPADAFGAYAAELTVPKSQALGPLFLEVAASDAAGNVSRRTVSMTVTPGGSSPLAASGVVLAVAAAMAWIVVSAVRRSRRVEDAP